MRRRRARVCVKKKALSLIVLDRSRDNNTVFVCRVCWFVYSLVYFGCRTRNPRSIGQTKPVKVLRLICAKTYEQQLFRTANRKLGLGQAVLQEGAAAPLANARRHVGIDRGRAVCDVDYSRRCDARGS